MQSSTNTKLNYSACLRLLRIGKKSTQLKTLPGPFPDPFQDDGGFFIIDRNLFARWASLGDADDISPSEGIWFLSF